jgi:hypothetical protein
MQGSLLFEYAVVRVVPQVAREEFVNAGVILYCSARKFLECMIVIDEERLHALYKDLDFEELKRHVHAFERICAGGKDAGPIGQLSTPERFRWLTAARSTVIQTSKVHPGLCIDPAIKIKELFEKSVNR